MRLKRYTYTCQNCQKVFTLNKKPKSDIKYCSRACLYEGLRTGRTLGTIICQYCGKESNPLSMADVRRQKYCSTSCRARAQGRGATMPNLSPDFGHWLAGLVDGEGCFTMLVNQKTGAASFGFTISLRDDDTEMLATIRDTLGFGYLNHTTPTQRMLDNKFVHPKMMFAVRSLRQAAILVSIFRQYPLRSKKARDFAVWAEAVELSLTGLRDTEIFLSYRDKLRQVRKYT